MRPIDEVRAFIRSRMKETGEDYYTAKMAVIRALAVELKKIATSLNEPPPLPKEYQEKKNDR